jgi:hypothetical protein
MNAKPQDSPIFLSIRRMHPINIVFQVAQTLSGLGKITPLKVACEIYPAAINGKEIIRKYKLFNKTN